MKATLKLAIPGHASLDTADALVEKARETAYPSVHGRDLTITWETDEETPDAWALRGRVQDNARGARG